MLRLVDALGYKRELKYTFLAARLKHCTAMGDLLGAHRLKEAGNCRSSNIKEKTYPRIRIDVSTLPRLTDLVLALCTSAWSDITRGNGFTLTRAESDGILGKNSSFEGGECLAQVA